MNSLSGQTLKGWQSRMTSLWAKSKIFGYIVKRARTTRQTQQISGRFTRSSESLTFFCTKKERVLYSAQVWLKDISSSWCTKIKSTKWDHSGTFTPKRVRYRKWEILQSVWGIPRIQMMCRMFVSVRCQLGGSTMSKNLSQKINLSVSECFWKAGNSSTKQWITHLT